MNGRYSATQDMVMQATIKIVLKDFEVPIEHIYISTINSPFGPTPGKGNA